MFTLAQQMNDVVNFGIGEPDFDTPQPIREAGIHAIGAGHTHYTANAGTEALRSAVAEKLRTKNGIAQAAADSVIVTAGGMGALFLAMLALLDEGDEVLVTDPGWTNYEGQIILGGGTLTRVPAGKDQGFALTADSLRTCISPSSKILVINSPANPTGTVLSRSALEEIAGVATENDLYIVSDEVYEHFVWDGVQHTSIGGLPGAAERTITVGSFSKSYAMTGWRVGYAAGPQDVISAMVKLQENIFSCAASVSQQAAIAALRDGEDSLTAMIAEYAGRRQLTLDLLGAIPGITAVPAAGSFYVFADISQFAGTSEQFALDLLESERVVVVPGTAFGPGGEGYVRISYATDKNQITEGMNRLRRYVTAVNQQ